jgi:hypothetical protein
MCVLLHACTYLLCNLIMRAYISCATLPAYGAPAIICLQLNLQSSGHIGCPLASHRFSCVDSNICSCVLTGYQEGGLSSLKAATLTQGNTHTRKSEGQERKGVRDIVCDWCFFVANSNPCCPHLSMLINYVSGPLGYLDSGQREQVSTKSLEQRKGLSQRVIYTSACLSAC